MDFTLTQDVPAAVDAVDAALVDPAFLVHMSELPKLGSADVVSNERDGDVVALQVRYLFQAELSAAVTRVVDAHHTTCVIRPDNYANLLEGSYEATIVAAGSGCRRTVTGRIKVHVPLLGGKVEKAIVSGLSENAAAQVDLLVDFIGS